MRGGLKSPQSPSFDAYLGGPQDISKIRLNIDNIITLCTV